MEPDEPSPPAPAAEPEERDLSYAGMRFEVSLGSSKVQAVQFNACELGPLALEVTVGEDETVREAHDRAIATMTACRIASRDQIINAHLDDIERAGELASKRV